MRIGENNLMTITEALKQAFESRGVINLKQFLSADKVAEAVDYAHQQFAHEGLWQDGQWRLEYDVAKEQRLVSKALLSSLKKSATC